MSESLSPAERQKSRVEEMREQRDRAKRMHAQAKTQRDQAREVIRRLKARTAGVEVDWHSQRAQLVGDDRAPKLDNLSYFPGGTQNPYLRLLYSRCPEYGFDPHPLRNLDHLYRLPPNSLFHLHWTRTAQLGATDEEDARARTLRFQEPIEQFVKGGGTLIWSVHEPLPHDCDYPQVEAEMRERLVELAAGVHLLHESTIDEVRRHYKIDPTKTFVAEHSLYTGVYPDYATRAMARRLLAVEDHEVLLIAFGAIRPYKGFDRLVRLLPTLRRETGREVRVMIAGPTMRSVDNTALIKLVEKTPGASMTADAVPDEHVQLLFRAADVCVLPYRHVLNSGVLMLGLTFGTRSVAPRNPVTADTLESGIVHLFDRSSDSDLTRAITEAVAAGISDRELPQSFLDRYDADSIAAEFGRHLREIVETR